MLKYALTLCACSAFFLLASRGYAETRRSAGEPESKPDVLEQILGSAPSPELVQAVRAISIPLPTGILPASKGALTFVYWETSVAYLNAGIRYPEAGTTRYLANCLIALPVNGVDEEAVTEVLAIAKLMLTELEEGEENQLEIATSPGLMKFVTGVYILISEGPGFKRRRREGQTSADIKRQLLTSRYSLPFSRFNL